MDRIDGLQLGPQDKPCLLLEHAIQCCKDQTVCRQCNILRNCHQEGCDNKSCTKWSGINLSQWLASQNSCKIFPVDWSPSLYIADSDLPNNTMKVDHFQSQALCCKRGRYNPIISNSNSHMLQLLRDSARIVKYMSTFDTTCRSIKLDYNNFIMHFVPLKLPLSELL